jgi:CBS domain-containing protein
MSDVTVRDEMSDDVLTIEPARSLQDAAREMGRRNVGAIVVVDPEQPGPGIVTERDVSRAVGNGDDPAQERVIDHVQTNASYIAPDTALAEAARVMTSGGFRHLVVVEGTELVGVLSMRDVVRRWSNAS